MGCRRALRGLTRSAPSRSRALRKFPDGNFRRSLVGSLRALTSAEMVALRCNAAARIGFLLAALHSVAERVNPRKARPPTPHGPRVPASAGRPRLPLPGEERTTPGLSKNQNTDSCDLFHPRGHTAIARNQERSCGFGGGGVRCGLRASGGRTARVVRLPMADSLCDRMERGEEEAITGRRDAFQRNHFCKCQARRLPTSGRRKSPSGDFRRARDLEGAKRVSRGQAYRKTSPVPRLPEDRTARLRHRNPATPSPFVTTK